MAKVWIPSLMRDLTGGQTVVTVKGSTVRQIVENLEAAYPGTRKRLLTGGKLKPNIGVAVDGDVSRLGLLERVRPNSEVHFLPAVAGGRLGRRSVLYRGFIPDEAEAGAVG